MKKINIPINKGSTKVSTVFNLYKQTGDRDLVVKYTNEQVYTKDDLISLYDIYNIGIINGQDEALLSAIIENRDIKSDMATIFDCSPDEITDSQDELLANPDKYVVLLGDLSIIIPKYENYDITFSKLKYIRGHMQYTGTSVENIFPNLCAISKNADLFYLKSAKGLEELHSVGSSITCFHIEDATGLENLEIIGGNAGFNALIDASMLKKLKYIMGSTNFYSLVSSTGLETLEHIGGDLYCPKLIDPSGFKSLEHIGGKITINLEPNDIEKVKNKVRLKSYIKTL